MTRHMIRPREFGTFLLGDYAFQLDPSRRDYKGQVLTDEWFQDALKDKLEQCGPKWVKSVKKQGIIDPPTVVFRGGGWVDCYDDDFHGPPAPRLTEGHHRWAYAYEHDLEIPVDFFHIDDYVSFAGGSGPDSSR